MLNLRAPGDSRLAGTAMDKLAEMLLGSQPPPCVQPTPTRVDLGVKTKTQLVAERQVGAPPVGCMVAGCHGCYPSPLDCLKQGLLE